MVKGVIFMKVKVFNCDSLGRAQVRVSIPVQRGEEVVLMMTQKEFDRLGNKVITELESVKESGYFLVKIARILRGLKQSDMAKLLNISVKTYQRRESKLSNFKFIDVQTICEKFNMREDTLFFLKSYLDIA